MEREEGPHPQPNHLRRPQTITPTMPWAIRLLCQGPLVAEHHGSCSQDWPGWEGHGVQGPRGLKLGPQPSPMPTDGFALGRAPLAPPYAVVLISCSGLLAFIFLLLTCLCCKRGDVGFKVRCTWTLKVGRKPPARPFPLAGLWGVGAVSLRAPWGLKLWQDLGPRDGEWGTVVRKMGRHAGEKGDGLSPPFCPPSRPGV